MHELGVVFSIINIVEETAAENNVSEVSVVTIDLGEVSSVIPDYLKDCWNWAVKKTSVLQNAELRVNTVEAVTYCTSCEQEYPTVKYGKKCPYCGSGETYLIRGNEFIIKEIEVPA